MNVDCLLHRSLFNKEDMKRILFAITFLLVCATAFSQEFPGIEESVRINQLKPKEGKVRMVLDMFSKLTKME